MVFLCPIVSSSVICQPVVERAVRKLDGKRFSSTDNPQGTVPNLVKLTAAGRKIHVDPNPKRVQRPAFSARLMNDSSPTVKGCWPNPAHFSKSMPFHRPFGSWHRGTLHHSFESHTTDLHYRV